MKPTRKLPRRVQAWGYAIRFAKQQYWRGFTDGAREAHNLAVYMPWTDTEINAYYARTRGY